MNLLKVTFATILIIFFHFLSLAQPSNDEPAGAILLTSDENCVPTSGELLGATPSRTDSYKDIWYKFEANNTKHYFTITGGTKFNGGFEIFTGTIGSFTSIYKSATAPTTNPLNTLNVTLGSLVKFNTYYFRVYSTDALLATDDTKITICVKDFIKNDDCSGAIELQPLLPGESCSPIFFGNSMATASTEPLKCLTTGTDDVWFMFKATNNLHYITLDPSTKFDGVLELYYGGNGNTANCSTKSYLKCSNNLSADKVEILSSNTLIKDNWYFIRVYNSNSDKTTPYFSICITTPPENDNCTGAKEVKTGATCNSLSDDGTYATNSGISTNIGTANDDIWFYFTADTNSAYINVNPSPDYNPVVQVFQKDCITPLNPAFLKDVEYPKGKFGTSLVKGLTKGEKYYYRIYDIESTNPATMSFTTCVVNPQKNDTCLNATLLAPNLTCKPISGNTTFASTSFPSKITNPITTADDDLWYKFDVATPSNYFITINASYFIDPVLEVYSGTACPTSSSTPILKDDVSFASNKTGIATLNNLAIGTYYYRIFSAPSTKNNDMKFSTCVTKASINDNCNNAKTVFTDGNCESGDGMYTTQSFNPCDGTTNAASDDVWYKFKALDSKQFIIVNPDDSNYDPVIQIYANCTTAFPNASASCLDIFPTGKKGNALISGLQNNTEYFYRVYDKITGFQDTMTFTTCVKNPVVNDDCGVKALTVTPSQTCAPIQGNGEFASQSLAAGTCGSNANDDVWFQFTATKSSLYLNIEADDSNYSPVVEVFSDCPTTGPTHNLVKCESTLFSSGKGKVQLTGLTKDKKYFYRVYEKSGTNPDTMTFNTCIIETVSNDDCIGAIDIIPKATCTPIEGNGNFASQSIPAGSTCGSNGNANNDTWYSFTPTKSTQFISVDPTAPNYSAVIEVFSDCPTSPTTNFVLCKNFTAGSFGNVTLTGLNTSKKYYYRVYDLSAGILKDMTFKTCVAEAVSNDECAGAIEVIPSNISTPTIGNGTYTTESFAKCNESTGAANDDVWFYFTASTTKETILVEAPSNFTPVVQYFPTGCPSISPVITTNCNTLTSGELGKVTISTSVGTKYFYRVYDQSTTNTYPMEFKTYVLHSPANDDCSNATSITPNDTQWTDGDGSLAKAPNSTISRCVSSENDNDDVWYKFRPSQAEQEIIVKPSSNYDPVIQIFTGCGSTTPIPLTGVACTDNFFPIGTEGSFKVSGLNTNVDYYYRVFDKSGTTPKSPLLFQTKVKNITPPPVNDNQCNAILITPEKDCVFKTYSTQGATASTNVKIPTCGGYSGGDVWFKTVVPFSGELSIETDELTLKDGGLAVYKGTCKGLSEYACDDDDGTNLMSKLDMTGLNQGDTIWIRVWNKTAPGTGDFNICIKKGIEAPLVGPCTNLDFENGTTGWFGTIGNIIKGNTGEVSPSYLAKKSNLDPMNLNTSDPQFSIVTGGIDKYGLFPTVFQGGKSLMLGFESNKNNGRSIEQYFTVTPSNARFTYNYAAVLNTGVGSGHGITQQPMFKIEFFDDNGNSIGCGDYLVTAPLPGQFDKIGFSISPINGDVFYKPWTTVSVDLTDQIGKNVHVRFTTGTCSDNTHFGYAYLDISCGPFQIIKPTSVCVGDTAILYAPKGAASYEWKDINGIILSNVDSLAYKTTSAGSIDITCDLKLNGSGLNMCNSTIKTTIEVKSKPTLIITDPDPVCEPNTVDLTLSKITEGSSPNLTFSYYSDTITPTTLLQADAVTTSGKYFIKGARSNTCVSTQPVNVKINPIPKIENKTTTICSGEPFSIKPINSPPADVVLTDTKYKWTVVNNANITGESNESSGQIEISQTLTNNSDIAQDVIYTVIPFTADCDGLPFTLTVTVNPTPKIDDKSTDICSDNSFNIIPTNTSPDIVPQGTTYTWIFTDNSNINKEENSTNEESSIKSYTNNNLQNTTSSIQSVEYTVTPKAGTCTGSTFKVVVNVNPKPKIPDFAKNICTGTSFNATPIDNGMTTLIPTGTTYTWLTPTVTGNVSGSSAQSNVTSISQTLTNPTSTNQTVTYLITANSNTTPNCSATFNAEITVEPKIKPVITCGTFDASSIEFNWNIIPNATFKYQYKIGSGSYNTLAPTTNLTNQKINGLSPGDNVTIKVIPENILCPLEETQLCSNCAQPTIVNNDISSPNDFEICVGETIKLKSSEIPTNDNQWSFETNGIATNVVQSSKDLNNITGVTAGSTDIYFTNNTGCKASIKLFVRDLPSFTPTATSQCEDDPLYLQANYSGATKVVWSSTTGYSNNASIDSKLQAVSNASISDNGTYSVEVTNSYGCKKTESVIVSINPLPTVTAGPDKSICIGSSVTLTGAGASTYTWDNNVTDNVAFSPILTKTYTVTGTDLKGCKNTGTIKVTVNALPIVSAGTDQYVCKGSPLTLAGSGASTYTWDGGITDNVAFNPTNEKDYTVTGKDANDCVNTDVVHVYINPLPTFTPTATSQCENDPLYLQANYSGATNVVWSSTTGYSNNASTDSKLQAVSNASISDNGTYSVEVTDGNGCKKTESILVTINPLPTVSAGVDQAICIGSQTKLVGLGGVTYNWNNGVDDNINFSPTATKTYTVIGTDSKGCKNSDDIIIKVNPLPIVSAGLDIKVCIGGSVTLYGTGASSYTWDGGITDNVAFYPTTDKDYTVTGKDANDCINTDVVHVTVNQLPEFIPTATSQCLNDPLYVHAHFTNPKLEKWSGPNGFIKTCTTDEIVTAVASASLIDNGPYSVEVIDQNDCKNTKTVNVSINPLPTVSAGVDQSICLGSQTKLIGSGAVSYTWNNGVVDNTDFSPTTTKTYTVIGTDSKGCKNTDQVEVKINPLPNFTLSVNAPCEQETLSFTVDLSGNPSSAGINSSIWTGPNGFNSNILNTSIDKVTSDASGIYSLTIEDNNLCSRTKTTNATISLIDKIQFADVKPKCVNDSPFLLPVPNINGGTWSSNDNTSIQDPYKGLFDPSKSKPDQDYKVQITYTTKTNVPARKCPSSLSKLISVNPIPDSNFYAINPIICIEDTLHLAISQLNQNVNYTWELGNNEKVKLNTKFFDYIYPKSGDYTVKLIAELGNCKVSRTIEDYIHVIPKPTYVDFTQSEIEIDFYNPEILFKSHTNGKYLLWSFGDGTFSTYKNPTHKFPEKPGEYIIDLTASNMENNYCSKTVTRSIFMPEPVIYFIPNTFTPNGDEVNNVFQPVFTYGYDPQNYSFYIYNRWGQLIFESHDSKIGWDGTYGDNLVQNDTYIWKLEFKEKLKEGRHFKTGHVNVFR